MHDLKELEGYARLVEAVIKDAFLICERAKRSEKAAIQKVLEFATRRPNPLLSEYCGAFEMDDENVRAILARRAKEALAKL